MFCGRPVEGDGEGDVGGGEPRSTRGVGGKKREAGRRKNEEKESTTKDSDSGRCVTVLEAVVSWRPPGVLVCLSVVVEA